MKENAEKPETPDNSEKPKVPFESLLYAEVSAGITVVGILIAVAGLLWGFFHGDGMVNEPHLLKDLFAGVGENAIWAKDSTLCGIPPHYWFFRCWRDSSGLSMIGLVVACYGGVVGIWGMFFSLFRNKAVLLYKNGLYTVLTAVIGTIMTLAALGIVSLR